MKMDRGYEGFSGATKGAWKDVKVGDKEGSNNNALK